MSFLLKRNNPWAWAGWYDTFNYPVGPIPYPWRDIGGGEATTINDLQEMNIPGDYLALGIHGPSFGFQPFTNSWGIEMNYYWPAGGAAAQYNGFFIVGDWSQPYGFTDDCISVRLIYSIANPQLAVVCHDDLFGSGSTVALINPAWSPVADNTFKVWIDRGRYLRLWYNGVYYGLAEIPPQYRTIAGRKGIRFFNNSLANNYVRWFNLYDRPSDLKIGTPPTLQFFDDFSSNSLTGWTTFGQPITASGGNLSISGGNDGRRGVTRGPLPSGNMRVEARFLGSNSSRDSGLLARVNSARTTALSANIFSNKVYISKSSGTLGSPTFTDLASNASLGITNNTNDVIAFSVYDDQAWIENITQDKLLLYIPSGANAAAPETDRYHGLTMQRGAFQNSPALDDYKASTIN